jgi:hypothetical protein
VSASEKLGAMKRAHIDSGLKVVPIYRKTGSVVEGADAFSRARDVESVMDALPQIVAVVEAAESAADEFTHKWLLNTLDELEEALT